MFFAIVFILLGLFLLLNAMGIIVGNFWGFFWAVVFLAVGIKMLVKKDKCVMCGWGGNWHQKMHGNCECECDHDRDHDGHDHH